MVGFVLGALRLMLAAFLVVVTVAPVMMIHGAFEMAIHNRTSYLPCAIRYDRPDLVTLTIVNSQLLHQLVQIWCLKSLAFSVMIKSAKRRTRRQGEPV